MASKTKGQYLVGRWISIEYEDKQSKAKWYKGLVRKYDPQSDRYLIIWETGGQDWVDELKDNEYKMAKPPAPGPGPVPRPVGVGQKRKRPVKEAKILVYGLPKSGKTSIINKLAEQVGHGASEEPPAPTHMFDVNRVQWGEVRLTIFDFSGKAECRRSLWKSYFDQADALVWVVDSTDRTHLDTCREELLSMLDFGVLDGVCLLLYANKLDLDMDSPLDVNEIADHLEFNNHNNKILQERLWHIQSCSAKTGDGLKDGMDWLVEKVKAPIQRVRPRPIRAAPAPSSSERLASCDRMRTFTTVGRRSCAFLARQPRRSSRTQRMI